jgi:hypothetical protein
MRVDRKVKHPRWPATDRHGVRAARFEPVGQRLGESRRGEPPVIADRHLLRPADRRRNAQPQCAGIALTQVLADHPTQIISAYELRFTAVMRAFVTNATPVATGRRTTNWVRSETNAPFRAAGERRFTCFGKDLAGKLTEIEGRAL